jgi:hypothetical protein
MMTLIRKRIGKDGCYIIFKETDRINGGTDMDIIVILDTAVRERNMTFPADSKLILAAIRFMMRIACFPGNMFRKTYGEEIK